jgi:hypothetical protein
MSCCPVPRVFPLRQPTNYRPPVPRWQLKLPVGIDQVFTIYTGIQRHTSDPQTWAAFADADREIEEWIRDVPPLAHESFIVEEGDDRPGCKVRVCYYTDVDDYDRGTQHLSLARIYQVLETSRESIGLWCEHFSTAVSRLETNYSGLDYRPGLGRILGTELVEHSYSAYWGAARDRIPDSGHDMFMPPAEAVAAFPDPAPKGLGCRYIGSNYENMVHIRSGQFWGKCEEPERNSYETRLEPALKKGLEYLWANPTFTGTAGLRFLRSRDDDGLPLKETCGAGFFRNLEDLERWAETHPSHKQIYLGAIKHAKTFGESRMMRTWHEVSVLKAGEAHFEYLNCQPRTGVMAAVLLKSKPL